MSEGYDVQHELDVLAAVLMLAVSLDLPDGTLEAYSTSTADVDPARVEAILTRRVSPQVLEHQQAHGVDLATEPVRVPPNPALGMGSRTCLPVRRNGDVVAYLWVLDDGRTLDASEVAAVTDCAERVSRSFEDRSPSVSDQLVPLFDDGPRTDLWELVRGPRTATRHETALQVVAIAPTTLDRGARIPTAHPARPRVPVTSDEIGRVWHGGRLLLLLRPANPTWHPGLLNLPSAAASGPDMVVGHGDPVLATRARSETAVLDDLSRQSARAIAAADCASVDPALPTITHWNQLGAYRRLLTSAGSRDWPDASPVRDASSSAPMLEHTLEVYLDNAGDAARSIAALGIHRTTFYYRLDRLAHHGVRLDDGLARTEHHLALKTRRLALARDHYDWSPALLQRLSPRTR